MEGRPYAVVVRLVADSDSGRFANLEARITDLLAATPSLGHVDSTSTYGQISSRRCTAVVLQLEHPSKYCDSHCRRVPF
jgi:hypothetical protein